MYIRLSDTFRNILSDFEAATAEVNSQKMLAKYNTTICIFLTIIFSIFSKIAQFFYFCRMPTFTNNNFFVDTVLHFPSPTLLVTLATLLIYSFSFSLSLSIFVGFWCNLYQTALIWGRGVHFRRKNFEFFTPK